MSGVSWRGGRSLQALLDRHGIVLDQAHRALADLEGVLALLSKVNGLGQTYFAEMLNG